MAQIAITITPELDVALTTLRRVMNVGREVPLTMAEYKNYIASQWTDGLVTQAAEHQKVNVREAYQGADQATQDQVKVLLGIS